MSQRARPPAHTLPIASAAQTRRAVRRLLRARRGPALAALTVLVAAAAAALVVPPALGRLVDVVTEGRGAAATTGPVLVLLAAAIAQPLLSTLGAILVSRVGEPALADLREEVVASALAQPVDVLERAGSGDLISRVSGDVEAVADAVRDVLPTMATSALTIGLTVVGWLTLDWRFAVAGLCAVPVQAHTLRWYLRTSSPIYAAERVAAGDLSQQLLDSIGGAATVRALCLDDEHVGLIETRSHVTVDYSRAAVRQRTRFFGRLNVAELIGLTMILVTGFVLVDRGTVTVGAATAAALFFARLFDPINALLFLVDDAQRAGAGLARLVGVADLPVPPAPSAPEVPADASIELRDVSFAYTAGHEVLHHVGLRVTPGEHVAVVGISGAGKTTIAKLAAGLLRPTTGAVLIGGADLAHVTPAQLAASVALLSQEVHVFAGPLADDLRLAAPGADDARLRAALDRVGATGWVDALDDGLDTVVGDGGHRLTPTQGQQLALARIALAATPIVLLDEATAEAGSTGARELERAAWRLLDGRTAIVIAHRLSQAAQADRIVVVAGGRIIEDGAHDQLLAAGGEYARLWAAWSSTRRPLDEAPSHG